MSSSTPTMPLDPATDSPVDWRNPLAGNLFWPLLGDFDQAFQYIQEFTGFFTPGIVVIFLLGMF